MIDTIMLFSAGFGNRMRHLTQNSPKSLIPILNKPILHHALELCMSYPFKRIIINTHYLHQQVEDSVQSFTANHKECPEIIIVYEKELLETGGAIKNAKQFIGNSPLFTLNTDTIIQYDKNIFKILIDRWCSESMEFLLLMQPIDKTVGYTGHGDFELAKDGKICRPDIQDKYSYVYTGLQILNPLRIYKNPLKIFSLREYYLNGDRIYGTFFKGTRWYHATNPEDLVDIEISMLAHEKI